MRLLTVKRLSGALFWFALIACSEAAWGSRIIPGLDERVRSADVIVVAKLERVQEKYWTMVTNARHGASEARRSYNWGFLRVKEVLKSPEKGDLRGTNPDLLNVVFRAGVKDELWTSDNDFTFEPGVEGIWLLHEGSRFGTSLLGIGFYYLNFEDDRLDLDSIQSFRERYSDILD